MLLNILQCPEQPSQQRMIWTKMLVMRRLRDPGLERYSDSNKIEEVPGLIMSILWWKKTDSKLASK